MFYRNHQSLIKFSVLASALLAMASSALAHPVPDLPVRSYFTNEGGLEIRVEVDPRSFDDDPEGREYLVMGDQELLPPDELSKLHAQADVYVKQRLAFYLEPSGAIEPSFEWQWRKLGDEGDPSTPDDQVVLVGSGKCPVPKGATAYQLGSLKMGADSMGIPLNVMFLNFINGEQVERYAVLFPGETSFAFELTGLLNSSDPSDPAHDKSGIKADSGDWWALFTSEIRRGFLHVVPLGMDHILFVLGVFLMTRARRPLILQISAFTVAHTLTLWLASAGWVNLPPTVIEPIIALSIVAVAMENIFLPKYTHWRLLIVFAFGLIHGLGFAGVMSTKIDSSSSLVVGLLGINIGVEFGQLAVIAAALLVTAGMTNQEKYRKRVVVPGSILIALAGLWWATERTLFA
tara:strand:- start:1051 stop:2262 length:1212 start_codon:yes stop_codon:yes gene_type:complete